MVRAKNFRLSRRYRRSDACKIGVGQTLKRMPRPATAHSVRFMPRNLWTQAVLTPALINNLVAPTRLDAGLAKVFKSNFKLKPPTSSTASSAERLPAPTPSIVGPKDFQQFFAEFNPTITMHAPSGEWEVGWIPIQGCDIWRWIL